MKNELKKLFTGYWNYLAVNAACELKLFDKISEGKTSIEKLCIENKWDNQTLTTLILELKKQGFLKCSDEIELSEKGLLLTSNHPETLLHSCMHWADEHLTVWQNISYTIKTGDSVFEKIYEKPFFDYLNSNPQKLDSYHKAMFEYARDDYKNISSLIDFSKHEIVIDIGGGYGALINELKKQNAQLRCILFDLPEVIKNMSGNNIEKIPGSFFEKIPIQADALILSRVIHDWNNEKAKLILKNCYQALNKNGVLYLIEILLDKVEQDVNLLSLNMKAVCNSYERMYSEYLILLENEGFKVMKTEQLNELQFVITACK